MGLVKLSDNEIEDGLKELNGWTILNGKLHKEIEFVDFDEAWKFMDNSSCRDSKDESPSRMV